MMLFSWRVQAASVKLVDPVHTAGVAPCPAAWPLGGPSRTTYLECISCGAALIALVCTGVPLKCCITHSWVPTGAGSPPTAAKRRRGLRRRFPGVVGNTNRHAALRRLDEGVHHDRGCIRIGQAEVVDRDVD